LIFQQESGKKVLVYRPTIDNDVGCPLEYRLHPAEIFFIQLRMEGDEGGNRCVCFPTFIHVEQAAELEQKILFIGRKRDAVVFPTNTNLFLEGCFGKAGFFRRLLHERNKYILYALEHLGLVR